MCSTHVTYWLSASFVVCVSVHRPRRCDAQDERVEKSAHHWLILPLVSALTTAVDRAGSWSPIGLMPIENRPKSKRWLRSSLLQGYVGQRGKRLICSLLRKTAILANTSNKDCRKAQQSLRSSCGVVEGGKSASDTASSHVQRTIRDGRGVAEAAIRSGVRGPEVSHRQTTPTALRRTSRRRRAL